MRHLKVLLAITSILIIPTPCYAEGQYGMGTAFVVAAIFIALMIAFFGGLIIRGICWIFKLNITDFICFIISGIIGVGFLILSLMFL